mgnify:CR=1 FL=1
MTINELREKRNQAWNAAKAFVETKRDKDGLLSEEDAKTYRSDGKEGAGLRCRDRAHGSHVRNGGAAEQTHFLSHHREAHERQVHR